MDPHHQQEVSTFTMLASTAGSAVLWIVDQLRLHGPSWSLIPAILVAGTGFVGAVNTARNDQHRRKLERDREAQIRASMPKPAGPPTPPSFDQLEGRGQ